ncbi:MAG TPA: thiamine-phosphate kinase [Candidatus Omnitrophota bacterium]|nr:thiamine-phosphate kinase [Candidatus Omnitrophota bacterium]
MKISALGEFGLIERIKRQCRERSRAFPTSVIAGIGDDTAVVALDKKRYSLLTTDMIMEGVHFRKDDPAYLIGRKALACNLSDIAAMGGVARYALVSLGISGQTSWEKVRDIYRGIHDLARKFGVSVVGGDTVKSQKIIINIALTGEVKKKQLVLRSGAKVGDHIFVTGALGGSLKSGQHLKFTPRIDESQYLVKRFHPTSMIDVSDGLAADLGHILTQSKVGATIYEKLIPRRLVGAQRAVPLHNALYDGEDFELIVTVPAKEAFRLMAQKHFRIYRIGEITKAKGRLLLMKANKSFVSLNLKGYRHF